jgi:hypothetical protein
LPDADRKNQFQMETPCTIHSSHPSTTNGIGIKEQSPPILEEATNQELSTVLHSQARIGWGCFSKVFVPQAFRKQHGE